MMLDQLAARVTGRPHSLFAADVDAHAHALAEAFAGRRVLVVGGAGSIGAATLRALLPLAPAAVHVLDQNENGLAELVRDLRSAGLALPAELRLLPLDFGSPIARRFLGSTGPYDVVMNFAALKHVRSEKDVPSLLQLLDTNVAKQARFLRWLAEAGAPARYFAVSTDKAANPVSFMGASKRLMEHVLFSGEVGRLPVTRVTSARFANVAFSAGSLLESFLRRLEKRQPLAVPELTRRFFVSLEEAAHICLLSVAVAPHAHVAVPRLDPSADLLDLEEVASLVLRAHGWEPAVHRDERAALAAIDSVGGAGESPRRWPLLVTPRDTDGEKPYEEFVGEGERAVDLGLRALEGVPYAPAAAGATARAVSWITERIEDPRLPVDREQARAIIAEAVPAFAPIHTGRSLDDRM